MTPETRCGGREAAKGGKPVPILIRCPKCDVWTLPAEDERWCPTHGVIPLKGETK